MRKLSTMVIMLLILLLYQMPAFARYYTAAEDYGKTSEMLYKGFPQDWHLAYFLKEFDKIAPAPGVNWTYGTSKRNSGPQTIEWVVAAKEKGWIVQSSVRSLKVGAMAISRNDDKKTVRIYIVREVHDWGFLGSCISSKTGEPIDVNVYFSQLLSNEEGYTFKGYIWPERQK